MILPPIKLHQGKSISPVLTYLFGDSAMYLDHGLIMVMLKNSRRITAITKSQFFFGHFVGIHHHLRGNSQPFGGWFQGKGLMYK